ncbi:hypothetical protein LXL04_034484 [Taraxacum kok-saghyz]
MTTSAQTSTTIPTAQQLVYAVSNVYNQFSFKLTSDGSKFKLWCRIFKDICQCAKVLGHINGKSKPTGDDNEDWHSIDSRVKSWFYSTCDPTVLQVITTDTCTAQDMWNNLQEFFLNNKMPRMLQLQEQFRNTKKGASIIQEYCHNLKHLADALHDVDSTISELELVMQILRGLPSSYHSIVDVITNTKPFPSFLEAKNMLLLHENREDTNDTLQDPTHSTTTALYSSSQQSGKTKNKWNKNRNNNRGTSKGGNNSSISPPTNHFVGTPPSQNTSFAGLMGTHPSANGQNLPPFNSFGNIGPHQQPWMYTVPGGPSSQPYAAAAPQPGPLPAHFPSHQPAPPSQQQPHAAFFGQPTPSSIRPNGSFIFQPNGSHYFPQQNGQNFNPQQPTDLSSVFQAMSVQPPPDNQFYMDTGASSHMNFKQDYAIPIPDQPPLQVQSFKSIPDQLLVKAGISRPVRIGSPRITRNPRPFTLLQEQHPLTRSKIMARPRERDALDEADVEAVVDVADLDSGVLLQRCDSDGDLYPCTPSTVTDSALTAVSLPTWHRRLGHPGSQVLQFLQSRRFISSSTNKIPLCHAYIQAFQCDNGREFNNRALLTYLQSNGITIRFSCPYTSQQNGKAERSIRTINNIVRTFLFQASLAPTFWTEALLTVVHTLNLLPTSTLSFVLLCY